MNTVQPDRCGIILLAAGRSDRLGTPKQDLVYQGRTLFMRSLDAALGTGMQPVIAVLGSGHTMIEKQLAAVNGVRIVLNDGWEEGMASSVRCGVEAALREEPGLDGLVMMVCDQPFVTPEILKGLYQKHFETGTPVVASSYENIPGVPVYFNKSFFNRLLLLKGDMGARKLLKEYAGQVSLIAFPQGATDIDTIEDYNRLKEEKHD